MISIYPKIIFEFIGIMVLTIITYYLLITGIDKQNIIAILGLYIAALVKILPCVVKLSHHLINTNQLYHLSQVL